MMSPPPIISQHRVMIHDLGELEPGAYLAFTMPEGERPETIRQRWYHIFRLLKRDPRLAEHPHRHIAWDVTISVRHEDRQIIFTRSHFPRKGSPVYTQVDAPKLTQTIGEQLHVVLMAYLKDHPESTGLITVFLPYTGLMDEAEIGDAHDEYYRTTGTPQRYGVGYGHRVEGGFNLTLDQV